MSVLSGIGSGGSIQGNIPFSAGAGALGSSLGGGLGASYTSAYNAALAQNQAQYNNILGGYQQVGQTQNANINNINSGYGLLGQQVQGALQPMSNALGQQQAQQGQIQSGYGQLQDNVLNTIQGITRSQQQAIQNAYQQQSGNTSQQLINSGLGNTTVMGSMQSGLQSQQQQALTSLANQQAQLTAGYQSNLGLAGLNYANQASAQNTAQQNLIGETQANYANQIGQQQLGYANAANQQTVGQANNQLGFMNSVQMQYPNAQSYTQLAEYQGMMGQMQGDQALQRQLMGGLRNQGAPTPPIQGMPQGNPGFLPMSQSGNGNLSPYQSSFMASNPTNNPYGSSSQYPSGLSGQVGGVSAQGMGVYGSQYANTSAAQAAGVNGITGQLGGGGSANPYGGAYDPNVQDGSQTLSDLYAGASGFAGQLSDMGY